MEKLYIKLWPPVEGPSGDDRKQMLPFNQLQFSCPPPLFLASNGPFMPSRPHQTMLTKDPPLRNLWFIPQQHICAFWLGKSGFSGT